MEIDTVRLRQIRQAKGLSMRELEYFSGVRHNTIWRIENGHTTHTHLSTVVKLADALGVEPTDLMKG